jgi:hypothetical protein
MIVFRPPKPFILVLLLLIAVAGRSAAETLYLGRFAAAEDPLHLDDLLVRGAEDESLGERIVPLAVEGGAVYLTAGGVSALVGVKGADFVGSGVWIYSPKTLQDEAMTRLLLARVSAAVDDIGTGLRIEAGEFEKLLGNNNFNGDLRVQSRGDDLRLYGSAGSSLAVGMSYLKTAAPPVVRVPAGSEVSVLIYRGGLTVEAYGRTNRSANVGESVPVTLGATRRSMDALLTGPEEAEVRL